MSLTIENILLIGSLLLFIGIIVGKTSYRFGVPALLLFLAVGMLAGSEGIGGIYFDNPQITQFIGIVSLNFILFSGGLDTHWKSIKPVLWQGVSLSSLGVLFTSVIIGLLVWLITDFSIYEGLLLGAIVSSTDAAAVFSILRSRNLSLKNNLKETLELESGSNDPMAYVLTITFLGLVQEPNTSFLSILLLFFQQMIVGAIGGYLFARFSKLMFNKLQLVYEGLYPILAVALMLMTFAATDFVGGNGFLAVYICAVYIGNQNVIHKNTIVKMFDSLAWLVQIMLFITLGLLVFPSQLLAVAGIGLIISLALIFIARPLSVFVSLLPFKMKARRRFYISWVGLRGAVPIVFATYPLLAGIEKADMIFNIVFFISLTSVLVQGTTLHTVAKWLNVALPQKRQKQQVWDAYVNEQAKKVIEEISLASNSEAIGKKVVELHFPEAATIAFIIRNDEYITPSGTTIIEANDTLMILSKNQETIDKVHACLNSSPE